MEDYGLEGYVFELNYESAKIAKEVTSEFKEKKYVAGSIGPTNKTASMSPDVNDPGFRAIYFDELVTSYKEQIKGLVEGGSDLLFIETVFDTLNAKAALMAIDNYFEESKLKLPVMISGTITDKSGRTLSGQTLNAFLISISHFPLLSIGFNCALGSKDLNPYMKRLSISTDLYTSSHPNAGLPNAFGQYDQTPKQMVDQLRGYLEENLVNIIGGCCGTTYEHIELIAEEVKKHKPRKLHNE
jgi:5-methyltetrahydrofolate--homocysteine methyltransferase